MHILDRVGNTPLVTIDGIYVKPEYLNPSGSIKDRIAKYIMEHAESKGLLKPGYTIIEASSGNSGIAFSMASALKGYNMIVVLPTGVSMERTRIIRGYGAKIISVPNHDFTLAIAMTKKLGEKPKTFLPSQFDSELNVEENSLVLSKEILTQLQKVDAVVAGVGTGGTLIGVGITLKRAFPGLKVYAVEPAEDTILVRNNIAPLVHGIVSMTSESHHIEGIGDGIVPGIISRHKEVIDGIISIPTTDAMTMARNLCKRGYFVGPSSGANLLAALMLKKKHKHVLTFFCDDAYRYISEGLLDDH